MVTSGLGGKFPPGYPVARVTRIDRSPDAPFSDVLAQPRAHLDRSREVLLVWTVPNQLPERPPRTKLTEDPPASDLPTDAAATPEPSDTPGVDATAEPGT